MKRRQAAAEPRRRRRRRRGHRWWRWCLIVLGVAGLIVIAGWLALWASVDRLVAQAIPRMVSAAGNAGVNLEGVEAGSVRLAPPLRVVVEGVRAKADLGAPNDGSLWSAFDASRVTVRLTDPVTLSGWVRVEDFSFALAEADLPEGLPFDRFTSGHFESEMLPLADPRAAALQALGGIEELFFTNETRGSFDFAGTVVVRVDGVTSDARLFTEPLPGQRARLRFDPADVRKVADAAEVELSDDAVRLVSEYPLRVPTLIELTDRARDQAANLKQADPAFPEDAFRHLTWSFSLTKSFGPEFAKLVTDAHETLPNNTPDERAMDYHNNALGRQLAEDGAEANTLVAIVQDDPRVIRSPDQVAGRDDLLR